MTDALCDCVDDTLAVCVSDAVWLADCVDVEDWLPVGLCEGVCVTVCEGLCELLGLCDCV